MIAIAAGERYSLALLRNGTVMAWGENAEGELATGKAKGPESCVEKTVPCSRVPLAVAHLTEVAAISAGDFHSLALQNDGNVMAWGANTTGELGDGASEQRDAPTAVCAIGEVAPCAHDLDDVRAVSAGLNTSIALLTDGSVVDWGANLNGELGDGSLTGPETCGKDSCSRSPVAVSGLSEATAIATGVENTSSVAVDAGAVMTWGEAQAGGLGDGTETASDTPVHVCQAFAAGPCPEGPDLNGEVTAIAAGGQRALVGLRPASTNVTSVSPMQGPGAGGTRVTITGAHLGDASAVHFGTVSASEVEVSSQSEIVAVSPAGAGVVGVTVTTPEGTSAVTLDTQFTYEDSTVTRVSPASGPAAGGTTVAIAGTKLSGASTVRFGTTPASEFEVRSAGEIVAVSPPGSGVVDVTVTTSEGTSQTTSADQFSYETPHVTALSPAGGPAAGATTVTITGTRLTGASAVDFGATPAREYEVRSPTEISTISPAGSGIVDVTVTTPEGTSPTGYADRFSYEAAPTVLTGAASTVHLASATLNGTVNPEDSSVTNCHFDYGTTASYGSSVPCAVLPGSGGSAVSVSAASTDLQAGATYHFRVVATNAQGTSDGTDATFATPAYELPELGRCLKLSGSPTGRYHSSTCTSTSAGEDTGAYEWHPGPGPASQWSAKGGAVTVEALNAQGAVQRTLTCTGGTTSGEYHGQQGASLAVAFTGCTSPLIGGPACQSAGASAGEVRAMLDAQLGLIASGAKPSVGWDLQPAAGPDLAAFECDGTPFAITGSVIGTLTKADKMSTSFTLKLKATKAVQTPARFEEGLKDVPIIEEQQAGLTTTDTIAGSEAVEVKAAA